MLRHIICWRCGEAGHYSSKCTKPKRSFQDAATAFVSEGHGTTEEALFWLSAQFDCHLAGDDSEEEVEDIQGVDDDTVALDTLFEAFANRPDFQ